MGTETLNNFLAAVPTKCPGCKRPISRSAVDECPLCGEELRLEVVSLRQLRWSDPGAIPVVLTIALGAWGALHMGLFAALLWRMYNLTGDRGAFTNAVIASAAAVYIAAASVVRGRLLQ